MNDQNQLELIDIYDVWYQPLYNQSWFMMTLYSVGLLLVIGLLYIVYKKYIQKKVVLDCAVIANKQIQLLEKSVITHKRDSKDCYFSLSLIIKQYLACRYHTVFMQLTDKEIVRRAEQYMTDENVNMLKTLLKSMVFVKFEHEIAAAEKLEKDIQLLKDFIHHTTPAKNTKEI